MRGPPPDPALLCEVYIDESSQNNHRYLVLGGVAVRAPAVAALTGTIWKARLPQLPAGELKWSKVSRSKLAAYMRVVDAFFDEGAAQFHSLFVDTTKLDHALYNQGSRDIGFNKEIYQLAIKCGRLYKPLLFHIYPDKRTTPNDPNQLRDILNRGIKKHDNDQRDWPYRRVQFRDSRTTPLLQVADIFAGAIAYRLNGHHTITGASPAKIELSRYILARAGITNVARSTLFGGKFTIWERRLKTASRSPRP